MTVDQIHDQVVEIEREITELAPGAPELAAVVARIRGLRDDLDRTRGTLGPLVPDAASPKSPEETSAEDLEGALVNLQRAAESKQQPAVS